MMSELRLSRGVEKYLTDLHQKNPKLFGRFIEVLREIAENPFSAKALTGELKNHYSSRVGDYRILFEIDPVALVIYIKKIGHRKDVYR